MIKGTKLFINALKKENVDKIFGYPGGYAIDIFDELYKDNSIEVILPRHEQALIHEAEGYAKSTGKVGVCLVTSGPGATNLVTGIADANFDSVPLVCFTGQVPLGLIGNDAFQEVDIIGITRPICKYGVTVRDRKDLGRIIKNAFYIAKTGKPGVVVVDLPKDIMLELGENDYPENVDIRGYKPYESVHVGQIKKGISLLKKAKKPLLLAGGGVNLSGANDELREFVEKCNIPVVTTIMGRGAIPTNHPLYVGNIGMHGIYAANKALEDCDLLLSIGTRFNDRITGKTSEIAKNASIVHIDIDASAISRNISVDIPIVADAKTALLKMLEYASKCDCEDFLDEILEYKKKYPLGMKSSILNPEKIIKAINNKIPNRIVTTDVGQHQMWTTQYLEVSRNHELLLSGGLGTMGFGFPAAIGAKIANMDKNVVCITGDGGFQMNIQEIATAVCNEINVIVCIFNNTNLGMVRQWQNIFYGKRYSSTCLRRRKSCGTNCQYAPSMCPPYTPDFVKLAESYGALGMRVTNEVEMNEAFDRALLEQKRPVIIEFMIDSDECVLPMVPGGKMLKDVIMDC